MAIAAAELDMEKFMAVQENQKYVDDLEATIVNNPTVKKLVDAAETVEDVYGLVKSKIKVAFEDFKILFDKAVEFYKEPKVKLDDEVMDNVVGGWSFGSFWNKYKTGIIALAIVATCAVAFAGVGLAFGALASELVVGACVGGIVGAVAGGAVAIDQVVRDQI